MNKKISVIVPNYNTEKYLNECIDSILNQTFGDFELICVDDGSTDKSIDILNDYAKKDSRVKILPQKENKGLSHSRNVGLDHATGDYIMFIDSDDYIEAETLEECYSLASEMSLDILIFKLQNFDNETGEKIYRKNFEMKYLKDRVGDRVFNYNDFKEKFFKVSPTVPAKLYKRELISDLRFEEGLIFEDNPFSASTLLKADRIYFYDKHLYNRRLRNDSISHSYFDSFSDCVEIYEIIMGIMEEHGVYNQLKEQLLKNQCKDLFNRFRQVPDEYKKSFHEKIKTSFLKIKDRLENEDTLKNSDEKTRAIFTSAVESQSEKEFELKANNRILEIRQKKLENKLKSLKNKNKKLKKEKKALEEKNNMITNSKSWKVTSPLRKMRNFKR